MNTLENLFKICNLFKEKEFSIQEFQSRLETLLITDEYSQQLGKSINESVNRLEEIIFTASEENYYKNGFEVADKLIMEVELLNKDKL